MCGISGTTKDDRGRVELMSNALAHRGPDGADVYVDENITLGHRRLAIIDLSDRALQPMKSVDGRYVIVFNGEIYNYRELREELRGAYRFQTESDTEVLLVAYMVWGEQMFTRLRGIFAFGIWDTEKKELLLARDHMGVKPLYYTLEQGVLSFASEIPALMQGMSSPTFDMSSVGFYLSMEYVPGPKTLIDGIFKLRPGQFLRFKNGSYSVKSFLETTSAIQECTSEGLYNSIGTSVQRQLVSDRPVGAYLSGGFDSSIVVHHMAQHVQKTRTYSVDFESVLGQEGDSAKFNADARLAERTASYYGTDHKTFTITLEDIRNTIERATSSANEPIANATAITQFLLSDFVRKDGTVVVLGGDGGDELFAGYTRHRIAMGAYMFQQLPQFLQRFGAKAHPRLGKLSIPFFTPLHMALMVKDEKKINPFLVGQLHINKEIASYFDELYNHVPQVGRHPLDVFMEVDRQTWLADECFIRSDYASMAHGLELRVPFVDIDLVRYANEISIWKKVLPHQGKRILRDVYKSHLPKYLYAEPKRGWLSPAAKWFRDPVINKFAKEVFSSQYYSGLDSVFDWKKVQELLDAHVEKRGYHLYPLWNILVLQIWARANNVTAK